MCNQFPSVGGEEGRFNGSVTPHTSPDVRPYSGLGFDCLLGQADNFS